jgi:hypothetical protein
VELSSEGALPVIPAHMAQSTPYPRKASAGQNGDDRAIPKTRLVLGMALEKAAKSPLFSLNLSLLSQKLKFWKSLDIDYTRL